MVHFVILRKELSLFFGDDNRFEIIFAANENFRNRCFNHLFDLLDPITHTKEGLLVCCIIHNHDAIRFVKVVAGDVPESLLASSVPYL